MAHAALRSILAASVLATASAQADIVRVNFTGAIYQMGMYDYATSEFKQLTTSDLLGPTLSMWDTFNGYVDFDRSMHATVSADGLNAQYELIGSATKLYLQNDAGTFTYESLPKENPWEGGSFSVHDGAPNGYSDRIMYRSFGDTSGGFSNFIDLTLTDYTGDAFTGTAIPNDLSIYHFEHLPVGVASGTWMQLNGTKELTWGVAFTSMNAVSVVPEPSGWAALIAGLGVIGVTRRRSRQPL